MWLLSDRGVLVGPQEHPFFIGPGELCPPCPAGRLETGQATQSIPLLPQWSQGGLRHPPQASVRGLAGPYGQPDRHGVLHQGQGQRATAGLQLFLRLHRCSRSTCCPHSWMNAKIKKKSKDHCLHLPGGWWFSACGDAFLNGKYFQLRPKVRLERKKGIQWRSGPKAFTSLKSSQMSVYRMAPPSSMSSSSAQTGVFPWSSSPNYSSRPYFVLLCYHSPEQL